jgi:DNA-binding GntR family transcriptional regulator
MHSPPTLDRICAVLRQQIVDRSVPPGAKLSEPALSRQWKVSRTPIREALRRLEAEGLLCSVRNKGFVVSSISFEDVDQLYTIMISLDSLAGRLATPALAADPARLKALEKLNGEMEACLRRKDARAYIEKNLQFHLTILHATGNRWLIRILENLHLHTNRFILNALYIPQRMEKSSREHFEILSKLKKGDGKGVEQAIARHFRAALTDLHHELGKEL